MTKRKDEMRVASRGKRDKWAAEYGGFLRNPDPTQLKFTPRDGIGLYTRVLYQYAFVAGICQEWVDHILVTNRQIRAAKAGDGDTAGQELADQAATRMDAAWHRVANRVIVLQKLLYGRFYGFSRAEKVLRYDTTLGEWIHDLYDVPQECWRFDDDGRDYLVTADRPGGVEVDPAKFIHFQWGSADTKYGEGDLSKCYLALWKIQKLETLMLQRVEDNESTVIVHVPTIGIAEPERKKIEDAYGAEFRRVIVVPAPGEGSVRTEAPWLSVTSSGAAGRPEQEPIRMYERWIQTMLLGAPQTGDRAMGTGKLEDVRKEIWDDKTPLGSSALDQCLTKDWADDYCDLNLSDLPRELRPRFDADATGIAAGISGVQASTATTIGLKLAANEITRTFAEEMLVALGFSRTRAQAMTQSIVEERDTLAAPTPVPGGSGLPSMNPEEGPEEREDAA